jgi:hypothetical protein
MLRAIGQHYYGCCRIVLHSSSEHTKIPRIDARTVVEATR